MPVFVKDGVAILYVHVPKTGGTAIETFFAHNGFALFFFGSGHPTIDINAMVMRNSPQHMHAAMLRRTFHLRKFKYIFMTVRDPYTRAMSEHAMRQHALHYPGDMAEWVAHAAEAYARDEHAYDNHIRPQSDFLLKSADIFRQEDGYGPQWVAALERRIGITFTQREMGRPQRFVTESHNPATLAPAVRTRLAELYKADFATFGYPA